MALVASAAAALASPPTGPRYALGRLEVVGGNPVAGVAGGVIVQQAFDAGCNLLEQPRAEPAAGSLGTDVEVEVQVIACPSTAPEPRVACDWSLSGGGEGHKSWRGWRHRLPLELPESTGVSELEVSCTVADRPAESFTGTFYVTYAPPLDMVDPPLADWYLRAVTWGGQLPASTPEQEVIRRIQLGLYAYGQRAWRYGYCVPEGGQCAFGAEPPVSVAELECCWWCDPPVCKCPWDLMVAEPLTCNFADCYVFSDVLEFIAATMGVGGLRQFTYLGGNRLGFATRAPLDSLDPRFTGNYLCGRRELPCRYLFGNHSLARRDREVFDSTFGEVYGRASQVAGFTVACRIPPDLVLRDGRTETLAEFRNVGYGEFSFFEESLLGILPLCPQDDAQFSEGGVRFLGARELRRSATGILIEVEVELSGDQQVVLEGGILVGDAPVSLRPRVRFKIPSRRALPRTPGRHRALLHFAASRETATTVTGPYTLQVWAYDGGGRAVASSRFEVSGGEAPFTGVSPVEWSRDVGAVGIDPDAEGVFRALRITATLEVLESQLYSVVARLSSSGQTIAYVGRRLDPPPGSAEVVLDVPGSSIRQAGLDGTYAVTLGVFTLAPPQSADSVESGVGEFEADDFR